MNKKILTYLFAGLITAAAFTACGKQQSGETQNAPLNSYAPVTAAQKACSENVSDTWFNEDDMQKIKDLMFCGYRHMKISDFQKKVWEMTDTAEYRELLDRLSKDEGLYEMRDSDETADFLFYVLEPLTAEKWRTRTYSGSAKSDFLDWEDNAVLEYTFTLTILNDDIMVKDYYDTRAGVKDALKDILRNRTKEELQNETLMSAEIEAYANEILSYMQTPELSVDIEFKYFPLSAEEEQQVFVCGNEKEVRRYSNGTEEDYRSLLALKNPNYRNLPIADFNRALLEWTNENYERMERIDEDLRLNDYQVPLTSEEMSFLKLTVFLSGMENGKAVQGLYTGKQPSAPYYDEYLPQKTAAENGTAAWCDLYYRFSYTVSDTETVTVGERDSRIEGMINAVRSFWNETDIESLMKMSDNDIAKELKKIAAEYSSEYIVITPDEQIHFEKTDERSVLLF